MTQQIFKTRKTNIKNTANKSRAVRYVKQQSAIGKETIYKDRKIKRYLYASQQKNKIIKEQTSKQAKTSRQWKDKKTEKQTNYPDKKIFDKTIMKQNTQNKLRIIPLGGCEEVGRNMTVFEHSGDIVILDMGMQFPEEDQLGIDYIIPNIDCLRGKEKRIKGVVFTHGHLDHIGAAPILLEKLGWPLIIGSKLTVHMIKARVEDYKKGNLKNIKTKMIESYNYNLKLGSFKIRFFPVTHSILDSLGIILETDQATVVHPGDWKLSSQKTPIHPDFRQDQGWQKHKSTENTKTQQSDFDYKKLSMLRKPTVLMLESLGVTYKNPPLPEREMYENIEKIISHAKDRVIIATFASNIERVSEVLKMAQKYERIVAVDGFSMKSNIKIAKELGYIKFNIKKIIDISQINDYPNNKIIIICTGAQGEENAVLSRVAHGEHRFIKFKKTDTIIFSSSVIPGNERSVQRLKDLIYRQSDNVIHSEIMDVHSGGHATAADIKQVIDDIKPTYFMPIYANHYMLKEAAKIAKQLGYNEKKIFIPDNGSVIEFTKNSAKMLNKKVVSDPVFVDGLGISDLQNVVLRDRQILSEDGMIVVIAIVHQQTGKLIQNPDIISRGFVYLKENKKLIEEVRQKVRKIIEPRDIKVPMEDNYIRNKIRNNLGQFVFSKTGKRPMVLPVVIEV